MNTEVLSYYKILSIETNATDEQINKAFKEKAMLYHPDKDGQSASANEMFRLITDAKICLLNPESRLFYDYSIGVKKRPETKEEKEIPILNSLVLIIIGVVIGFVLVAFSKRK